MLGLWLQVHGHHGSTESCRGGVVPTDRAAVKGDRDRDSGRASAWVSNPGPRRASDGWRVSWFTPQNQGGGGWRRRRQVEEETGVGWRLGLRRGRRGTGVITASRVSARRRGTSRASSFGSFHKTATQQVSRTHQNRGLIHSDAWHHREGCVASKQSREDAEAVRWTCV